MNKKGASTAITVLVITAVFLAAYLINKDVGWVKFGSTPAPGGNGASSGGTSTVDGTTFCSDPSNTMTVGPVKYKWSPTNTTSESSRLYVNGIDQGSKADGTTYTVAWKDKVVLLYGLTSNSAYANKAEITAPCAPFSTADFDGEANELILADGALTISCFNSDTGNKNAGTGVDNETIATGETGRFKCGFTSTSEYGASPNGKVHVLIEMNKSMYDSTLTTMAGKSPTDYNYPSHLALANADDAIAHYVISGCPTGDNKACDIDLGTVTVKAKDGENPIGGGGGQNAGAVGQGDLKVTFVYENYYQHTQTGKPEFGWAKDDGTAVTTGIPMSQTFYLEVD